MQSRWSRESDIGFKVWVKRDELDLRGHVCWVRVDSKRQFIGEVAAEGDPEVQKGQAGTE
jgi:hypothetical protein